MKKLRNVAAFLLSMLFCAGVAVLPVCAETVTQNGLEVTLTSDKDTYAAEESITATLSVKNGSATSLQNVVLEAGSPTGYRLSDTSQAVKQLDSLAPGQTAELQAVFLYQPGSTAAGGSSTVTADNSSGTAAVSAGDASAKTASSAAQTAVMPETGDPAPLALCTVLLLLSGSGLIVLIVLKKNRKKGTKMLSFFLCAALLGSLSASPFRVQAEESADNHIAIQHSVTAAGNTLVLKGEISYRIASRPGTDGEVPDFQPESPAPTFASREEELEQVAELNGGTVPYVSCDDNGTPTYIEGTFSDRTVASAADAIEALNDIHYLMGFENARQEFTEVSSKSVELGQTTRFYRLQQMYHGVPVDGYQMIVSTNDAGKILSLNGRYLPDLNLDISSQVVVSQEQALAVAQAQEPDTSLTAEGLCIEVAENGQPHLVWKFHSFRKAYSVSAQNGNLLSACDTLSTASLTGNGTGLDGQWLEFPVQPADGAYQLSDSLRSISVYDLKADPQLYAADDISPTLVRVEENSSDRWEEHTDAITAYSNLIGIYDYYSNVLGQDGADDNHQPIVLAVRACDEGLEDRLGVCYNAAAKSDVPSDTTYIIVGHEIGFAGADDILAHEYTHAVSDTIWDTDDNAPVITGSVAEAYSDIMGCLITHGKVDAIGRSLQDGEGDPYARDPAAPAVTNMDELGNEVHENGTLLTNVAYRIDNAWPTANHGDELATLFYKSMYYLSPGCNFLDCRYAVIAAARSMNMEEEKIRIISSAFSEVGIENEDEEVLFSAHHLIGTVKDLQTDAPIPDAKILAVAKQGVSGGIGYSDDSGNFDVKVNRAVYTVYISAPGYSSLCFDTVDLSSWFDLNYTMDSVYLARLNGENPAVSGTVTDQLTGLALRGATVKFRQGADNRTGPYMQTTEGLDIALTTDEAGQYYTAALPSGDYTLEASLEGYVTGYKTVTAGSGSLYDIALQPVESPAQSSTIEIHTVDGTTGNSLAHVAVDLYQNSERIYSGVTDDTGLLVATVEGSGTYQLQASLDNYQNALGVVEATPETTATVTLSLLPVQEELPPEQVPGDGSAQNPFRIYTAEQLAALAVRVNGGDTCDGLFFEVMNDIDLSAYTSWTPIGTFDHRFMGYFNGNNHTIRNLTILDDPYHGSYVQLGLFGYIHESVLENVKLSNVQIQLESGEIIAGLTSCAYASEISNCTVDGTITVSPDGSVLGGIIAMPGGNTTISNCTNFIDIDAGTGGYVGGISAETVATLNSTIRILNCQNYGTVSGADHVGEITGYSYAYPGSQVIIQ